MLAAGMLAKRAVEAGLQVAPWVKTSLAPGSKVVTDYLERAGLTPYLDKLGFGLVGYGCTTCIGNSGPLPDDVAAAVDEGGLNVVAVLSGNRNFEGRIHPQVRASYLASPPLVVAYALAGRFDVDLADRPARRGRRRPGVPARPLAVARRDRRRRPPRGHAPSSSSASTPGSGTATSGGAGCPRPTGPVYDWDAGVDLRAGAAVLRRPRRAHDRRHRGRAGPGQRRRLDHDRPHLAGRLDQGRFTRRPLPDRARRRAPRLQLVRHATGQPRGDDARHVRERAPAQRARARDRGTVDDAPAERRGGVDLRRRPSGTSPTGRRSP